MAGLLRANPTAGQAFCRLLVNSYAPAAGNDGSMEDDEEGGGASAFGFTARSVSLCHLCDQRAQGPCRGTSTGMGCDQGMNMQGA